MLKQLFGITLAAIFSFPATLLAQGWAPTFIPVQGVLVDDQGNPLDGAFDLTLSIYETDTAETPLHTETQSITVSSGQFVVYLGQVTSLDLSLFNDYGTLFLGLKVDADPEMAPRLALGSVPFAGFAQFSGDAQTLAGRAASDYRLTSDEIDWSDLTNVPTTATTHDTLASLTCDSGQVAKYNGSAWTCGNDDAGDTDGDATNELNTSAVLVGADLQITDPGGTLTVDLSTLSDSLEVITGSGTTPRLARFTEAETIGSSQISDNGTSVGIGTEAPDPAALLDLTSTSQGFLPPRMDNEQREAIASPPAGLIVFDSETFTFMGFNGTDWVNLSPTPTNVRRSVSATQSLTTISTTFVDIADLSMTITTGSSSLLILADIPGVTCSSSDYSVSFRLLLDGGPVGSIAEEEQMATGGVWSASIHALTSVTAGNHIVKVQWAVQGGTGSINSIESTQNGPRVLSVVEL